jgi:hypothetical protein
MQFVLYTGLTTSIFLSCAATLGCIDDNMHYEPDSWIVVGMLPVFDKMKAMRAGRPGWARVMCTAYNQLAASVLWRRVAGMGPLTKTVKRLQWGDVFLLNFFCILSLQISLKLTLIAVTP